MSSSSNSKPNRGESKVDSGNPVTGVSICIPRVFNNIGFRRIKRVFISMRWGYVERVDVIPQGNYKRAYVHFAPGRWNTSDQQAMDALAALQQGDEVKVLYDDPWYWKISLSRSAKPAEAPKPAPRPVVITAKEGDKKPVAPAKSQQVTDSTETAQ